MRRSNMQLYLYASIETCELAYRSQNWNMHWYIKYKAMIETKHVFANISTQIPLLVHQN